MAFVRFAGGAEVTQHPAGEVDRAAIEPRHLPAVDLGGVPGEGVQGQGRAPGHRVRVPGEQQRVQGRRGVGHPLPGAGRRTQQGQRVGGLALVGPEHPEPGRGGHPVSPLGQRERLAEEQLGLGQVAGRVPGPAADGQAAAAIGAGSTHAWADIYVPGSGWVAYDPTNGTIDGSNLIRVAVTRDISQAVPVAGSFVGPPDAYLGMTVDVAVAAEGRGRLKVASRS